MHIFHKWSTWSLPKWGILDHYFMGVKIDCAYQEKSCTVCGKIKTRVVG